MHCVFVAYPEMFRAFSKFERKLSRLTANLGRFEIVFLSDPNEYISKFANANSLSCRRISSLTNSGASHAILFDDGEEFKSELESLQSAGVALRRVYIPITRVINIKNDSKYQNVKKTREYEYIGRGSYWGNPYSMFEEGESREEVIRKFKYDFERDMFPNKEKAKAFQLIGKKLGCFCKPAACHGDVIAEYLNSQDDGK